MLVFKIREISPELCQLAFLVWNLWLMNRRCQWSKNRVSRAKRRRWRFPVKRKGLKQASSKHKCKCHFEAFSWSSQETDSDAYETRINSGCMVMFCVSTGNAAQPCNSTWTKKQWCEKLHGLSRPLTQYNTNAPWSAIESVL